MTAYSIARLVATTKKAWDSSIAPAEYAAFLSELLVAEHDRMRLLSAYLQDRDVGSVEWELREAGETPTPGVGRFYGRGVAIRELARAACPPGHAGLAPFRHAS